MANNEFELQVIANGGFTDDGTGAGVFTVETYTLRLNHVALNDYLLSGVNNCRDCYNTDGEWEAHKSEYKARREAWRQKVISTLGIDPDAGSVKITQAQSEVFIVVHIRKVA